MTTLIDRCQQFVDRHVISNALQVVEMAAQSDDGQAQEAVESLFYKPLSEDDYRDCAQEAGWHSIADYSAATPSVIDDLTDEEWQGISHFSADDFGWFYSWEDICLSAELDTSAYRVETVSYFVVSNSLGQWLLRAGEAVHFDLLGLVVWGRDVCGQSVALDTVIQQCVQREGRAGQSTLGPSGASL